MASRYAAFGYHKGCLIGNLAAEASEETPLLRKALAQSLKRWTQAITAVLQEGQRDRSIIASLDPAKTARFLINSWEGAIIRMKIEDSRQPLDDFFAITFPLLAAAKSKKTAS